MNRIITSKSKKKELEEKIRNGNINKHDSEGIIDISKIIYILNDKKDEGRTIVVFDTNYINSFRHKECSILVNVMIDIFSKARQNTEQDIGKSEFTIHVNMNNLSKIKYESKYIIAMTNILKTVFVDCLHHCFFIYPPYVFKILYRLFSPFIDNVTKKKFVIVTKNKKINIENCNYL